MQTKLDVKQQKQEKNKYPDYKFTEGETIKCFAKKFSKVKPKQHLLHIKENGIKRKAWTPLDSVDGTNLQYLLYGILGKYLEITCVKLLKTNENGEIIQEDEWKIRLLTKEEYERD